MKIKPTDLKAGISAIKIRCKFYGKFEENKELITFIKDLAKLCIVQSDFTTLKNEYIAKLAKEGYIYSNIHFITELEQLKRIACSEDIDEIKKLPNVTYIEYCNNFIGAIYLASRPETIFEKVIEKEKETVFNELKDLGYRLSAVDENITYTIKNNGDETFCYLAYSDLFENGVLDAKAWEAFLKIHADIEVNEITNLVADNICFKLNLKRSRFKNINNILEHFNDKNTEKLYIPNVVSKDVNENIDNEVLFNNLLNHFNQQNPYKKREYLEKQLEIVKHNKTLAKTIIQNENLKLFITDDEMQLIKKLSYS